MHTCNQFGFELYNAYNNTIRNNTIIHYPWAEGGGGSRSDNAIYLWSSHYNNISNNEISNWDATSIYFETYEDSEGNYSNYNVIWENNITNNTVGIEIHSGENNSIFYNNFYNTFNAYDYSSANNNFSYNWWENYDEPSEGAWDNDSNGIADDPYDISGLAGNSDRYPLMVPYELWTPPEDSPEPCNTSVEFYVVLANEKVQIKDDVVIKSGDVGVNGECADITLPPFPSFTPGSDDINVRRKKIYTLDEGDYGDITIGRRGKLIFTGGIYNINTLTTRNNVELVFLDRSEVHINNRLIIGKNCKVGPDIGSSVSASDIILYIKGADTVNIGRGGILNANIYAPNGTILLRRNVEATGSFIGKIVNIRSGVQLELDSAFK